MRLIFERKRPSCLVHAVWGMIAIFLLLLSAFLPLPRCHFYDLTGLPCLSCGTGRAASAFWEGDCLAMLASNPLMTLLSIGAVLWSLLLLTGYLFKFTLSLRASSLRGRQIILGLVMSALANWLYLFASKK